MQYVRHRIGNEPGVQFAISAPYVRYRIGKESVCKFANPMPYVRWGIGNEASVEVVNFARYVREGSSQGNLTRRDAPVSYRLPDGRRLRRRRAGLRASADRFGGIARLTGGDPTAERAAVFNAAARADHAIFPR